MEALDSPVEENVRDVLRRAVHPQRIPLDVSAHHLGGEPVPVDEALARVFEPFAVGEKWGPAWDTTWFRFRAVVPGAWAGEEVVALIHLGGERTVGFSAEGLVWDASRRPVQGLHHRHRSYLVTEKAAGGETIEFYVEAAANPIAPSSRVLDGPLLGPDYCGIPLYVLGQAELATVDRVAEALYLDACLALELQELGSDLAADALAALHRAAAAGAGAAAAGAGGDLMAERLRAAIEPILRRRSVSAHFVTAVGHAHIDSAWLWPARETRRKCARTFSNQLRLMDRYPEHRFACSQAAQYQWMKDGYPDVYARIKERVREGRWEPVGGMWVEADANVPSGESLVRQFLYGKSFFQKEFGVETHEMWIPDVFGYSAALPQIARQAGVTALITQKMSWNDTNVFPHSTFRWEGHDGSRILAHFPPADTYNGDFSVGELLRSDDNFKDRDRSDCSLYPFGYGDGGGGPTARMLEQARRVRDLEGLPRVEVGTVSEFLSRVEPVSAGLSTWVGELYLEAHRGTLTTHADVKRANRRGEEALRAAEMWSVAAGVDPRNQLEPAWKSLLFNQFHDILPGSSIHWVYEDAGRDHQGVLDTAERVKDEARRRLAGPAEDPAGGLIAFNPSSYDRTEVVELPDGSLTTVSVPGCSWGPVEAPATSADWAPVDVSAGFLDNGILRVRWNADGLLTSVWDHATGREVIPPGRVGNLFQLHEDRPSSFDAWNVDREYLERFVDLLDLESVEITERDPMRGGVRFVRRFGASRLSQTVRLSAGSRRIEFDTEVDWHERHRFLKVAFPVAVRSPVATYEIQHGHIQRPTVANTSWDEARFEVCGHRWADLSEPGYGVALLNDCKYGYDVRGDVLRLSLLRATGYPDPQADRGTHRFAYALLPHPGDLRGEGRVVEEAESFNLPLEIVRGSGSGRIVAVDRPGVSVEAVKWAEDGGDVIVRLCEVWGARGPVRVSLGLPFTSVSRTDLLERPIERPVERLVHDGSAVEFDLHPFQLVTLRFERA
jgi:alpha-mannosidase